MSTFFISDLHLGHRNMAIRRGFQDEFQMNEHIVSCWNKVVKKKDLVIVIGDVTMEKTAYYPILDRLNGLKTVVLGNHDEPNHVKELLKYVNKVAGMIDYKKQFILTHCPIHPSQLDYRYSYNIHGHCISEDSEILTENGWKSVFNISENDLVYSENNESKLELKPINKIIINNYSGIVYKHKSVSTEFNVTDKHRMITFDYNNNKKIMLADEYFSKNIRKVKLSGNINKKGINWSDDLLRLYIFIAADGSFNKKTNLVRIKVKKDYKKQYVQKLLVSLNLKYSNNTQKDGSTCFNFKLPEELISLNIKGLDKLLLNCSQHQCEVILEAYNNSDGYKNGKGTIIYTSKRNEVDLLQHLFAINGFSTNSYSRKGHGFSEKESYQLSIYKREIITVTNNKNASKELVNNKLYWCINTEYGNFLMRLNGKVQLIGNCHTNSIDDPRYINVSAEVIDYTPKTIEQLLEINKNK